MSSQGETGSVTENIDCHPRLSRSSVKPSLRTRGVSSFPLPYILLRNRYQHHSSARASDMNPPSHDRQPQAPHGQHQTTEPRRAELHVQHGSSREAPHEARVPHLGQHEELPELRDVGTELRSHGTTAATRRRRPGSLRAPGRRLVGTTQTTPVPERPTTGKNQTGSSQQQRD